MTTDSRGRKRSTDRIRAANLLAQPDLQLTEAALLNELNSLRKDIVEIKNLLTHRK